MNDSPPSPHFPSVTSCQLTSLDSEVGFYVVHLVDMFAEVGLQGNTKRWIKGNVFHLRKTAAFSNQIKEDGTQGTQRTEDELILSNSERRFLLTSSSTGSKGHAVLQVCHVFHSDEFKIDLSCSKHSTSFHCRFL